MHPMHTRVFQSIHWGHSVHSVQCWTVCKELIGFHMPIVYTRGVQCIPSRFNVYNVHSWDLQCRHRCDTVYQMQSWELYGRAHVYGMLILPPRKIQLDPRGSQLHQM